ncbi:MAG: phosphate/phosphite/phosphonate ABC transporter substrate-binding protein [Spirulina sp.]
MKRRFLFGYSLLFLASCSTASRSDRETSPKTEGKAIANLPETLYFAVTDVKGREELEANYEPFRQALTEILERKIEFFPVENYIAATPAMEAGKVNIVWAGPSEYLVLRGRARAIPLVALQRPTFHSVIIIRNDSPIQSLKDLQGKTIDLKQVGSTSAYLGGLKILLDAGLNPKSDFTIALPDKHSLQGLKKGEVDGVARAFHRYKQILKKEGERESDYRILARGPMLPGDVFAANRQLDPQAIAAIQSRMLAHQERLMQAILSVEDLASKFKDAFFAIANDADYDPIREIYDAIGQGTYLL